MSDMEIYYNLARKLGIYEELSEGNTEEDWIRKLFQASSLSKFISYEEFKEKGYYICLLYTSPSPRDLSTSRMPSSA